MFTIVVDFFLSTFKIQEDVKSGLYVENLTKVFISSMKELAKDPIKVQVHVLLLVSHDMTNQSLC